MTLRMYKRQLLGVFLLVLMATVSVIAQEPTPVEPPKSEVVLLNQKALAYMKDWKFDDAIKCLRKAVDLRKIEKLTPEQEEQL